ncbi:fibrinogen-binding protein [Staphylococcus simiae]|uniref:fibrinogen-binding protein n=1 Tax=Staphylococcus simiae TaxID=308354 RepID=UPI001A978BB1|nr:fibrinogen-binding protein [Staphylococcus simiae]MBO1198586.1 fibrinogen-binding protein [Staphylococcus simiae]MBO1200802.1 fibrinogen-binding protein [Staphylococcus simiae]MBO1203010.1 fibrinogen-binding protein [Staphylococcus simiae]MBO1210639.1 fibrinogen-binding protein [Staphylococcus simiae]MBO1229138.1 fibrinogen-binding protein [Staphylococcus simiae]
MIKKYATKAILSATIIGISTTIFSNISQAQQQPQYNSYANNYHNNTLIKLSEAKKAVAEFQRKRTIATHRKAQRAVNLVHFDYKYEKKKLQKQIDIVLKYNILK